MLAIAAQVIITGLGSMDWFSFILAISIYQNKPHTHRDIGRESGALTILCVFSFLVVLVTIFINTNKGCPDIVDLGLPA